MNNIDIKITTLPRIVAHVYNPSTWDTEAGLPWVWGQPEPPSDTLSQKLLQKTTIKGLPKRNIVAL